MFRGIEKSRCLTESALSDGEVFHMTIERTDEIASRLSVVRNDRMGKAITERGNVMTPLPSLRGVKRRSNLKTRFLTSSLTFSRDRVRNDSGVDVRNDKTGFTGWIDSKGESNTRFLTGVYSYDGVHTEFIECAQDRVRNDE